MPEEKNTAEISEVNASQDGVAGAVGANEEKSETSFSDKGSEGSAASSGKEKPEKTVQTKEQNSEFARKRREAERQKEMKELRYKTIKETLKGKNPYTGGEIKDDADIEEFLTMQEISESGGDPVSDYAKHQKEKARTSKKEEEAEKKNAEWFEKDREDFKGKYPEVDLNELISDEDFSDYAEGKVGKKPLSEIYEKYLKLTGKSAAKKSEDDTEKRARELAAQMVANKKASVGSLAGSAAPEGLFSEEEIDRMSVAEIERNWDKVQKSMKHLKKK